MKKNTVTIPVSEMQPQIRIVHKLRQRLAENYKELQRLEDENELIGKAFKYNSGLSTKEAAKLILIVHPLNNLKDK